MKYLQILNLTLTAIAATFALVLAVVAVLLAFNQDLSNAIGRQLPTLLQLVGLFSICTVAAAAAWWAHHRGESWWIGMQVAAAFIWLICGFGMATLLGFI